MNNMTWLHQVFPDFEIVLEYDNIDNKSLSMEEIHGLPSTSTITNPENLHCLFCNKPYSLWTKKDIAHAISECLGNKRLINALECYDCNHLFGEIAENHLGKFIMPYRFIAEVYGKDKRKGKGRQKNVIRDGKQGKDSTEPFRTFRFEQKKNAPVFESKIFPSETYPFDIKSLLIEVNNKGGRLEFTDYGFKLKIPRQPYDPRMVYASFLKMFYTLLPCVRQPAGTTNDDLYNPHNPQTQGQEQSHEQIQENSQEQIQTQSQSQEHYDIYNSDYCDYIKGQIFLYLALSKKNPLYAPDGSIAFLPFSEEEREKYLSSLPNKGFEVRYASKDIPNGVNVCLLRKRNGVSKATTSTVFNENETAGIGNRAGIAVNIENNQDNDGVESGIENSANNANSESIATISRDEPRYLFAVQLKWYTIVIPACSEPIQFAQPDMSAVATTATSTAANDNIDNYDILGPSIPYSFKVRYTPTSEITVRPLDFTQVESEMIFDMRAEKIDIPEELYDSLADDLRKAGLLKEKKTDGQDGQDGQNEQDNINKQVASSLLIQGFAKLHAIYAAILAQTLIGDESILVSLTLAMILSITQICGAEWSTGQASSFFKIFIDYYIKNRGFVFPLKWIPFVGNAVNAFIAFYMAETLGWVTYAFINEELKNPSALSAQERKALLEKAEGLRKGEDGKAARRIYTQLNNSDKKELKRDLARIIDHLREKDISYEERKSYLDDLEKLVKNYMPSDSKQQ